MDTTTSNRKKTDVTVEDLSDQIALLKNDIATLTSTLGDFGKAKTSEAARSARETMNDLSASGREKAADAQKTAEDFIRTQPATALGIAAGVGFLVGLVTARR